MGRSSRSPPRQPTSWIVVASYAAIYPVYLAVQRLKDVVSSGYLERTLASRIFFYRPLYLPPGMDWPEADHFPPDDPAADAYYHRMSDFVDAVPLAVCILAWRLTNDRFVAPWVARLFGVKSEVEKVTPCALLERHYSTTSWTKVFNGVDGLAKKCGMSEQECRTWLTKRRAMDKPTPAFRLAEAMFKFSHFAVTVSFCVLSMIIHEPRQFFTPCAAHKCVFFVQESFHWDLRFLVQWQLAFYYSSLYTHFFYDVRRSDHLVLTIHHFYALCSHSLGKILGLSVKVYVGLLFTDITDLFMELAKILAYLKNKTGANIALGCFASIWMVARVVMFPYYIIYFMIDLYSALGGHLTPAYCFLIFLQWLLIAMNLYWTRLIIITVYRAFVLQDISSDVRSDEEDDGTGEPEAVKKPEGKGPALNNNGALKEIYGLNNNAAVVSGGAELKKDR